MKKYLIPLILLTACVPHSHDLESVSEEVITKDRGVVIDIEPGKDLKDAGHKNEKVH